MKKILLFVATSLFLAACSSTPAPTEEDLGSAQEALKSRDADWPDPDFEPEPPPPPPPPPVVSCSNVTTDGVCRRHCCTETSDSKRCGVVPCPSGGMLFDTVKLGTLISK